MGKVVTFGEIMLRLSPRSASSLVLSDAFDAYYGGAEANVAVSLASYGTDAAFVSRLPDNEIGQAAVNSLRRFGVDTRFISRGGERLGVYYCENGALGRRGNVIYDRAYSAIAEANRSDFDWDKIFENAEWFHFSGITPALSDELAEICLVACKAAKQKGMTVSCDLNYRGKLWTEQKCAATMRKLCGHIDWFKDVFDVDETDPATAARAMTDKYGFKGVAVTSRKDDGTLSAMLYTDGAAYFSKSYALDVVDRVGAGDAFCGGLIYSLVGGKPPQYAVEFAAAACCIKHGIKGDVCPIAAAEVEALMNGADGRVRR